MGCASSPGGGGGSREELHLGPHHWHRVGLCRHAGAASNYGVKDLFLSNSLQEHIDFNLCVRIPYESSIILEVDLLFLQLCSGCHEEVHFWS